MVLIWVMKKMWMSALMLMILSSVNQGVIDVDPEEELELPEAQED